jgi:hypothetical protein
VPAGEIARAADPVRQRASIDVDRVGQRPAFWPVPQCGLSYQRARN